MRKPWDRGGLRTYLLVLAFVFARPDQRPVLWALPLLAAGLVLHIVSKGSLRQNQVVARSGPYRFVRHPFYLANLLLDESIAVMSGNPLLIALLPLWWLAVYLPVMRGEERHLAQLFPDVYPAYQARVPLLLPLRRPLPAGEPGFSWSNANIVADTVIPRALRIAALPLLFLLYRAFRADGLHALDQTHGRVFLLAALLLLTYGLAWEITRHLLHRRPVLPHALAQPGARLAVAGLFLAVACSVHAWEVEADVVLAAAGAILLASSLFLRTRSPLARLAAEGIAVVAATVFCETLWLAPLPLLFYSALLLDRRLDDRLQPSSPEELLVARGLPAHAYSFIVLLVLLSAAAKEFLT